jgi:hypothetical protein
MRRIGLAVLFLLSLVLAALAAEGQQAANVPRIGFLGLASAATYEKQMEAYGRACVTRATLRAKTLSSSTVGPGASTNGYRTWRASWFGSGWTSS